ncbi:MAG: 3-hydroxybutyryl-CoA dehydrogenase [Planctomycetes bacterium]|nr:3-hydroxybutyryl-CoA dehydrogenase [Planctomycetota bacterium]
MEIKKIGVIGTGTMGNGIAQVYAQKGFDVIMIDIKQEFLDNATQNIENSLNRLVKKERLAAEDVSVIMNRFSTSTNLDDTMDCDFVVEAVTENLAIKLEVHKKLGEILRPEVIIGSNTSSISITVLGKASGRPEKFIGMHFMNPVPIMKLVEVIRGFDTSDETYQITKELTEKLGKIPVEANDSPGFVANRLLLPMLNEAIYALYEGVAGVEQVDNVMKLGMGHPMGPLQLADFIGLDVCLAIMNVLYGGFKDSKYRPCPLLQKMVDAGHLGDKTGKGFYTWERHKITGINYC